MGLSPPLMRPPGPGWASSGFRRSADPIDGLWALTLGNNGVAGGAANTVYFTAGPFNELHGLFGLLTTAAPGSPEGPAEAQWVEANVDVVHLDLQQIVKDTSAGAPTSTITQDTRALMATSASWFVLSGLSQWDTIEDTTP